MVRSRPLVVLSLGVALLAVTRGVVTAQDVGWGMGAMPFANGLAPPPGDGGGGPGAGAVTGSRHTIDPRQLDLGTNSSVGIEQQVTYNTRPKISDNARNGCATAERMMEAPARSG